MRKFAIALLLTGQALAGAQPAIAAELTGAQEQRMGAFGGLRVRIPLDGDVRQRQVRAGIAFAPTLQTQTLQGESRTRLAEGIELGFRPDGPATLSIAGTPVSQLAQGPRGPDGRRLGVSTAGWVAIGVGTVVAVLGVGYWAFSEAMDCDDDEECS
jgi:hypothetical protein